MSLPTPEQRGDRGLTVSPICTFIHSFWFWHLWTRSCNIFLFPYLINKINYSVYICIRVTASPIQWTWTWANFGRWWRPGRPDVLQSMGSKTVRCGLVTEQQQESRLYLSKNLFSNRTLYFKNNSRLHYLKLIKSIFLYLCHYSQTVIVWLKTINCLIHQKAFNFSYVLILSTCYTKSLKVHQVNGWENKLWICVYVWVGGKRKNKLMTY